MSKPLDGKEHGKGTIKPAGGDPGRARFATAAAKAKHAARMPDTTGKHDPAPTARLERLAERAARVKRGA